MPDPYVILFIMLILATVLTYLLSSGLFERDDFADIPTVIPGIYSAFDSEPISFFNFYIYREVWWMLLAS